MKYSVDDIKNKIETQRSILEQNYDVKNLFLFGSYAKGLQTDNSDIDFLVEFSSTNADMFVMVDLQEFLMNLFGKKVDLGTPNGLKSFIKNQVLSEAIRL